MTGVRAAVIVVANNAMPAVASVAPTAPMRRFHAMAEPAAIRIHGTL
jgi:hypothetical protein